MQKVKFFRLILRIIYNVKINDKSIGGKIKKTLAEILTGLAVGAINGLFGGGGGMLCVPLLENVLGESVKISHASTVMIILPVCIAGAFVYVASGGVAAASSLFPVAAGAVAGGVIGSLLLKNAKSKAIAVIFALITVAAGVRSVWR